MHYDRSCQKHHRIHSKQMTQQWQKASIYISNYKYGLCLSVKICNDESIPSFGRRIVISKSKNVDVVIKLWRSERWTREIFNTVLANNNLKKTRLKSSEWNNVKFFISCFNITYKSINYLGKCFDSKTHLENHTGLQL